MDALAEYLYMYGLKVCYRCQLRVRITL